MRTSYYRMVDTVLVKRLTGMLAVDLTCGELEARRAVTRYPPVWR